MCGIAGAVGPLEDRFANVQTLAARLVHRGPDEAGTFTDAECSLAMRRLSIIDLAGGHQPLFNETRDLACICNGELYNFAPLRRELEALGHRFLTGSDVEVAVHAYESWGEAFLARVNGMFALALWDATRHRLTLARDRLGKKPLYVARMGKGLAFSSELRSLLAWPGATWTVDREACREFCRYGYLPGDLTPIVEIRRLLPGHVAVWDAQGLAVRPYWRPEPDLGAARSDNAALHLRDLLIDAVRLRLISDVPVGAFLSGGLDSSVIVALAAGVLGARIPTFSIAFPGYREHDESRHASRVAAHFGCEHHEIPVDPTTFADLPSLVWAMDEPVADPAALPTLLLSRAARRVVTVALTGEGADEVFGGYERYTLALHGARLARRLPFLGAIATGLLRLRGARALDDTRLSRTLRSAATGGGDATRWSLATSLASGSAGAAGLPPYPAEGQAGPAGGNGQQDLLQVQLADLASTLPGDLLTKVDRMTMAASIEARCPYLDYRVVNFGLGLHRKNKIRNGTTKVILRQVASAILPTEIAARKKHTFRVPTAEWLRGPLRGLLDTLRFSGPLARFTTVRLESVRQLVDDHVDGRADYSRTLWILLTLHLWLEQAAAHAPLEAQS